MLTQVLEKPKYLYSARPHNYIPCEVEIIQILDAFLLIDHAHAATEYLIHGKILSV